MVIDSNAMWHQWRLTGRSWDELRNLVVHGRIDLYVPEVVVQEVVRGRHHDANDLVRDLVEVKLSRIEQLLKLGLPTKRQDLTTLVQNLVADYETELRDRLNELGALLIPVPTVSHQVVLTRALAGRKPFDSVGHDGYRDVLIWHSLLDIAADGYAGVVFVTNNTSDFCTGRPAALLPALLDELADVSPTIVAAVAQSVNEVGARVEDLERRVAAEADQNQQPAAEQATVERPGEDIVSDALAACVDVIVLKMEPPTPGRWGLNMSEGWQFLTILEEDPVDVVVIGLDYATLAYAPEDGDWTEFTASVRAKVTLDGFAFKGDVYADDGRTEVDIRDADWNDHYMHVWEHHDATLTFRLTLNADGTAIEECWLDSAEPTEAPS
ncbi:uncharacterized protein DUF4935 [Kutzneria buriramensis]|uniref:Uncharacterized protein DUF4935 n=1 Tax=Kutzneria buriramensis TaxID=1045776 RepID=A0A3E0HMC1_9PSEU|nr:uncharacterized protein DUF4935 [Kutzneria buriramensis]